ncbi:MAG: uracil-DNA glycosylase family protein [Bacteroidota bacterium]
MENLLDEIRQCKACVPHLELGPRPIVSADIESKIVIIGQAPGAIVHNSGIPWNDLSGKNLRDWMGIDEKTFYDPKKIAIVPMGFCYPGKGRSGDLPPRKECAPLWHESLLSRMKKVQLILLIGKYAQHHYLDQKTKKNLTETVKSYKDYLPNYFVLPHPSPRNNIWQAKNPWFKSEVLPELRQRVKELLK